MAPPISGRQADVNIHVIGQRSAVQAIPRTPTAGQVATLDRESQMQEPDSKRRL